MARKSPMILYLITKIRVGVLDQNRENFIESVCLEQYGNSRVMRSITQYKVTNIVPSRFVVFLQSNRTVLEHFRSNEILF